MDNLTRERVRDALADAIVLIRNGSGREKALQQLFDALDDPARWCGVVGVVQAEETEPLDELRPFTPQRTGRLIVTPHATDGT